jgi:hypothetical protein
VIPLYFAIYVAIGVAFTEVRRQLIKHDCIWSILALLDYADGYMEHNAEEIALRNNRWLWIVWPPFVMLELMFGFIFGLWITIMGGWGYILGGNKGKEEASSDPYDDRYY